MIHSWRIRGENQEIVRDLKRSAFGGYEFIPDKETVVLSQTENLFVFFRFVNFKKICINKKSH